MKVLVTGATGFVGFVVADTLAGEGHDVFGLTRSAHALPAGVTPIAGDLLDAESVRSAVSRSGADAVCHLAALVRVRDSRTDPVSYWRTNVGGTLAVLDALARRDTPARLVVGSTCAVYGEADRPLTESTPTLPTNPYGAGKLAADHAVADLAATGAIGAISLRSLNIAGGLPGHADRDTTRLIPRLLAVAAGRAPELVVNGDGSVVRDYVHVADMADAYLRALDACEPGRWRAFNVGSGQRTTLMDVVEATERATGRPIPRRHQAAAPEPQLLVADPSAIGAELGWKPQRSQIDRITRDAWEAYC